MAGGADLESETVEGIGETREGLVTGAGLRNEGQGTGRTLNLTVGKLHTGSLGDIVLESRVDRRGHGPTAGGGERTRRISAERRPRQHRRLCRKDMQREEEEITTRIGFVKGGN